jgi:hypothetical protein
MDIENKPIAYLREELEMSRQIERCAIAVAASNFIAWWLGPWAMIVLGILVAWVLHQVNLSYVAKIARRESEAGPRRSINVIDVVPQ